MNDFNPDQALRALMENAEAIHSDDKDDPIGESAMAGLAHDLADRAAELDEWHGGGALPRAWGQRMMGIPIVLQYDDVLGSDYAEPVNWPAVPRVGDLIAAPPGIDGEIPVTEVCFGMDGCIYVRAFMTDEAQDEARQRTRRAR